jgi:hypothetical protein
MVPGIVDATGRILARRVGSGARLSPADVGAIMGGTAHRALAGAGPRTAILRRHAHGMAHVRRHHSGHHRSGSYAGYRAGSSAGYRAGYRPGTGLRHGGYGTRTATLHRQPVRSGVTTARAVPRPRPGFVRVVTPVRIPAANGTRTVRVVSDVRVPRGAVPAGRPVSVGGRRTGR